MQSLSLKTRFLLLSFNFDPAPRLLPLPTPTDFPPQNVTVKSITTDSITVTWSFPPSCFARTALWVIVNEEKRAVHKDALEFAVTGLEPGTSYTIYMVTEYEGNVHSDPTRSLPFTTGRLAFTRAWCSFCSQTKGGGGM